MTWPLDVTGMSQREIVETLFAMPKSALIAGLALYEQQHRALVAKAWDEGYGAGRDDEADGPLLLHDTANPYRGQPEPT